MYKNAVFCFARMPEDFLIDIRNGLSDLNIQISAVCSYSYDKAHVNKIIPQAKHYAWNTYRDDYVSWHEELDQELFEVLLSSHRPTMLPLFERYLPFSGGSMEAENRALYDFSRAVHIIKKHNPDLLLFAKQPENGLEYFLYILGRHYGIKTLMSRAGAFFHSKTVCTELETPILDENWNPHPSIIPICNLENPGEELHPKSLANIEQIINLGKDYTPSYMMGKSDGQHIFQTILAFLKKPRRVFKYLSNQNMGPVFKRRLYTEYMKLATDSVGSHDGPGVFFPLHYQPEVTTMPRGGQFVNQIKAIKLLSDAMPEHGVIYVKEHPSTFSTRTGGNSNFRPENYYSWIAKIPNVVLVNPRVSSAILQESCDFTACVTGAAGLEAILRGKKTIAFGNAAYLNGPGVFSPDTSKLKDLFSESTLNERISTEEVVDFIKKIDAVCSHQPDLYQKHQKKNLANQAFYKTVLLQAVRTLS